MEIAKSYITDEKGSVKSVVIDFEVFKVIEEALLDQGLAEAMEEVKDDSEIDGQEIELEISGCPSTLVVNEHCRTDHP